jgi:hypothetical protein
VRCDDTHFLSIITFWLTEHCVLEQAINEKVEKLTKLLDEARKRSEFEACLAEAQSAMLREESLQKTESFRIALGRATVLGDLNRLERFVLRACIILFSYYSLKPKYPSPSVHLTYEDINHFLGTCCEWSSINHNSCCMPRGHINLFEVTQLLHCVDFRSLAIGRLLALTDDVTSSACATIPLSHLKVVRNTLFNCGNRRHRMDTYQERAFLV